MKFTLHFKTPDILEQIEDLEDSEKEKAYEIARKFVEYSEYITVEFDTESKTAVALKIQ
jgi:hypothetical protein